LLFAIVTSKTLVIISKAQIVPILNLINHCVYFGSKQANFPHDGAIITRFAPNWGANWQLV